MLLIRQLIKVMQGKSEWRLLHPSNLRVGDEIKLRKLPQSDISNQRFKVTLIEDYEYNNQSLREFTLMSHNNEQYFFNIEHDQDHGEYLAFSKAILDKRLSETVDDQSLERLIHNAEVIEKIQIKTKPSNFGKWLTNEYQHYQDYQCQAKQLISRKSHIKNMENNQFVSKYFESIDEENYALDFEIKGKKITLYTVIYLPINNIDTMLTRKEQA